MEGLGMLIPLSIALVVAATWLFLWAVDNDQFSDLDRHSLHALEDDDKPEQADANVS